MLETADRRRRLLGEDNLQTGRRNAHQQENAQQREPDDVLDRLHPTVGRDLRGHHEEATGSRGDDEPAALAEKGGVTFSRARGSRSGFSVQAQMRLCCCWIFSTKSMAFLLMMLQSNSP